MVGGEVKGSVLCDVVQQQYPEVLEAVKGLAQLKEASKLELKAALKDVASLRAQIAKMVKVSSQGSCCDEDRWA